jgi:hypothetical protein
VKFPWATRRVSRTRPPRKEVWSCTGDGGRPSEAGSQVQASNHCKLRSSKAMVVSVAAKRRDQIPSGMVWRGEREQTVDDVSKFHRRCQNRGCDLLPGSARGWP